MRIECETLIGDELISFKSSHFNIAGGCEIAEVSVSDFYVNSASFIKNFADVRFQLNPDDSCFTGLAGLYEQCDSDLPVLASHDYEVLQSNSHDTSIKLNAWKHSTDVERCLCFEATTKLACTKSFKVEARKRKERDLT